VTEQTQIPATQVKELRDLTGAGMMDAKRALVETNGDLDAARQLLREQGLASAGKRAGRETTEGVVVSRVEGSKGALVAVGCETEPVSGNEEFLGFAQHLLDVVWAEGHGAADALEQERVELVAKLGENIVVVGAERYEAAEDELVADYIHPPARKIGVLVRAKATPELARMLAMHIAAARPQYLARGEIPEREIADERAVYEKLPEVESKPEDVRPKIVDGMLAKRFFAATVLLDQAWVHDPNLTVARALAERDAEVRAFVRYNVGSE
jgi:elongation factor Ts